MKLRKMIAAWTGRQRVQPAERPAAAMPVAPSKPEPKSTAPRPLASCELTGWTCPTHECGLEAAEGTHHWDDRGPYQLLSVHHLRCPDGHRWSNSTDGG